MGPDLPTNPIDKLIRFSLKNQLVVFIFATAMVFWGIRVAPFDWDIPGLDRSPIPVDAIPDIGENQQIVFTEWPGRSPQDVEDQITYPLTTALLGLPKVKAIRSYSMFGFASIYIIFEDQAEFYWTRSRILEKLNSLPEGTLPTGVTPKLGPDATAVGQVFWYTLEGRDKGGNPTGGWDLHELRSAQDWYVRFALQGVAGVSEVASIGGYVKEYQIDVDPDALRTYSINLHQVFDAVRNSNIDVGARTIEINQVEYLIRGLGYIQSLEDLRQTVIAQRDHVPITLDQVAQIEFGPAIRRGALDKEGSEAVGGVVVTRYGENPLATIRAVKEMIRQISPGLPQKILPDGRVSQLTIVPFYDRTGLIHETLGTLENAIWHQTLVTILVVLLMVFHLRSAALISGVLPLAVLFSFICMSAVGVDANLVALSGIAIAIGTVVDMGVVLTENILKHLAAAKASPERKTSSLEIVYQACSEVGGAMFTAVMTTVISFLPVFALEAAEGKLFKPLAYTKTFALIGSIVVALTIIPPLAYGLIAGKTKTHLFRKFFWLALAVLSLIGANALNWFPFWLGALISLTACFHIVRDHLPGAYERWGARLFTALAGLAVTLLLARSWSPLGPEHPRENIAIVLLAFSGVLGIFHLIIHFYAKLLALLLRIKVIVLLAGAVICAAGFLIWRDLENEFMPDLDEGSFLWMPTTMPHASIGEVMEVMQRQDRAIAAIPEIESVVGKLGRAESPLDPAPISMIETVIKYKPEYITDEKGNILRFAFDENSATYLRDEDGALMPDSAGKAFRNWRESIENSDDIWDEIVRAAHVTGTTSAPKLQPIAARLVMLQTGMRAPLGIKVFGPDLSTLESALIQIESELKRLPSIHAATVFADRVVGKPYLEIDINRQAIARYGIKIRSVQDVIEVAIGGSAISQAIEGRERYPIRLRYLRELRDTIEEIENILVASSDGVQIPLKQLAEIKYVRGPQMIKSEDTFLVGYVIFENNPDYAEVEVAEGAKAWLEQRQETGELILPEGVSFQFTGNYENQIRAEKKLRIILPAALAAIFILLHLQFRRFTTSLLVFSGIAFAWSGGFILIWLYGQPWFLDFTLFGANLRQLFQIEPINLSVAVWVGFLALFGIATDNGVIVCAYLRQTFEDRKPARLKAIREAVVYAGNKRVRPALMTSATTTLALLPILTSTGRGADIMGPMAIPTFGGMLLALLTIFFVPVLYALIEELKLRLRPQIRRRS